MKTRLMYALILVLVLCASTAGTVLAGDAPVVFYDDTLAVRIFPHATEKGGAEYVCNGDFEDWGTDGVLACWKQYVYNPAGNIHWAKITRAGIPVVANSPDSVVIAYCIHNRVVWHAHP